MCPFQNILDTRHCEPYNILAIWLHEELNCTFYIDIDILLEMGLYLALELH